jgi:hypothetical protein
VRMAQSRWVGVLATIALVVVSTIGLRLSDPEEQKFEVINGVIGKPAKVNNGEVTVTELRVGTILKQFGRVQDSTDGMFVAIRVTGAATGPRPLELNAARLLSGDLHYEGYQSSSGVHAEPGFETTVDIVFEVAPAYIDDLTLEPASLFTASAGVQRSTPSCPLDLSVDQSVRFEALFLVPARYANQLLGIALRDDSSAARTTVIRPPAL